MDLNLSLISLCNLAMLLMTLDEAEPLMCPALAGFERSLARTTS